MSLPILSSDQMKLWDEYTIEHEPISSLELMDRASNLACKQILGNNHFASVSIFCGPGNNGGDGLVIARLLHECQKNVTVYCIHSDNKSADFIANFKKLPKQIEVIHLSKENHATPINSDLIIDALFGSGLARPITDWIGKIINTINSSRAKTIAIDIPSGLFSVSNIENNGAIVKASTTLTFMTSKMSFFFTENHSYVGTLKILDIGLHPTFEAKSLAEQLESKDISIKKRDFFAHKGSHGYLTLIAGLKGMGGAAILSAQAAMKTGCGYVDLYSNDDVTNALLSLQAEVICQSAEQLVLSKKTSAIAIGPGLGKNLNSKDILVTALKAKKPIIIDADAITLISEDQKLVKLLPTNSILTPHLGELKRLVGEIESDEQILEKQRQFSIEHSVYIIQKGPYSKLSCPDGKLIINSTGNPGMASAGMGDVLTGIIGSLLAQGYTAEDAAKYGMYLHGHAADLYARENGEIGLLASDVINKISKAMNQFSA